MGASLTLTDRFPHYFICKSCVALRQGVMLQANLVPQKRHCEYCRGKRQLMDEFLLPWICYLWSHYTEDDAIALEARKKC